LMEGEVESALGRRIVPFFRRWRRDRVLRKTFGVKREEEGNGPIGGERGGGGVEEGGGERPRRGTVWCW
jgi:hypothetical protein